MRSFLLLFGIKNIPRNDYDINGKLTLLQNPVMPLNEAGQKTFLADVACITPKYLTEVSKKVSGFHANFWIDRFTITEITRLLSDKTLTLKEISERMNFASVSYFCRYVMRILKVPPSAYRSSRCEC